MAKRRPLGTQELKQFVPLDEPKLTMLKNAMTELNLAGRDIVNHEDMFEAIQYRSLDRQLWG